MGLTSGSGVVIQPVDNSPMTLALTMGTFVTRLLGQLNNQTDLTPAPPQVLYSVVATLDVFLFVASARRGSLSF